MLPVVKPHTFRTLALLDEQGLTNHVLVITRWRVDPADCEILNSYRNIRLTVLVTHSNIADPRIEPVDSRIAAASLRTLYEHAARYRVILYWRPIVPGLNDSDDDLDRAYELSRHAHATVFTGLFYRDEIAAYYREQGIPERLGVTQDTVVTWRRRSAKEWVDVTKFPQPAGKISGRDWWWLPDILEWAKETGRLRDK